MIRTNLVLKKRLKMLKKRYPILVSHSRRLITTKKWQWLKTQRFKTKRFITAPELNRLTETSFDAIIKKAAKSLASKSQVDTALDTADKNRKK